MSVSLSPSLPVLPERQGWYAKAVHLAKQYIEPRTLDLVESLAPTMIFVGCQIFYLASTEGLTAAVRLPTFLELNTAFFFTEGLKRCVKYLKTPFIKREIQTVIESSKQSDQSLLVFHSLSTDSTGVFTTHAELDAYQKLGRNYSIDALESSSSNDRQKLQDELKAQNKKYNRIDFHIHGSQHTLEFRPDDKISLEDRGFFEWLGDRIKPGGTIVLDVCLAGKGVGNIAQRISQYCPDATILAASDKIRSFFGAEYDSKGMPSFNDGFLRKGKNITRIYRGGNPIEG